MNKSPYYWLKSGTNKLNNIITCFISLLILKYLILLLSLSFVIAVTSLLLLLF